MWPEKETRKERSSWRSKVEKKTILVWEQELFSGKIKDIFFS